MTVFFVECLYCGHESHSATEAEHHTCEQNALTEKIDTLESESEKWRRKLQAELCQNAPLRKQNADLLAALERIAKPGCGCKPVCRCDDSLSGALITIEGMRELAAEAIARATGSEAGAHDELAEYFELAETATA
jgi:hypothetical protein